MTGAVAADNFLIGIPAGLSTTAVLWINQFPDYYADKKARQSKPDSDVRFEEFHPGIRNIDLISLPVKRITDNISCIFNLDRPDSCFNTRVCKSYRSPL